MIRLMVLCAGVVFAGSALAQQNYPSRPIRILNPQAAGGSSSALARLLGEKITADWGQQVLVDNRPGGNTIIATDALLQAPADGYTMLYVTSAHATLPSLVPKLPYDTLKDYAPVATICQGLYVLVVNPSVPAHSVQELITLAKSEPGQLNYASSGVGQGAHLAGAMFNMLAGTTMQHVPYNGTAPSITALLSGYVQLTFTTPFNAAAYIKGGQLRALAIGSDARLSILPDVPTFAEAGMPGMDINVWHGLVVKAGTPKPIIDKLSTEIGKILTLPDVKKILESQGFEPFVSTPDQLSALLKSDIDKYAKIIKTANIKLE